MEKVLEGKTILVAGAGGLLGSYLVSTLLRKDAFVIAADINLGFMKDKLLDLGVDISNENLVLKKMDITNEDDVKTFFLNMSHIDGAVNCTYPRNKSYGAHFFDVSLDSFNENLALHLGSAFLFTQQCAGFFKRERKPFSLVNISSIYGVVSPKFEIYGGTNMTMAVEYAAIKAAIQHLTKYVVSYIKDSRFRVNCVSPGGIFDNQPDAFLSAYKSETHGKGMLQVEDVVGSVVFLLSDQSEFMTGQNLVVDDGFSV